VDGTGRARALSTRVGPRIAIPAYREKALPAEGAAQYSAGMANDMAEAPDLLARGREVAGRLWGARAGGTELPAQKLAPEFFGLVTQFVFGMFWSRPNLDLRSRSLCTVAQLAALGRTDELKGHLAGALNLGIKREELIEVLMQTACYAGVPAAVTALNAAADVLR
jgi:4-carboxymuconolactone decarboxylase